MKGERYPVPRHRSTSLYKVGLNADTEPNSEIFANYVNNRGEKLMILVGPPQLFETPDDPSIQITRIGHSIYAVVNGRTIASEAVTQPDVSGSLSNDSDTPIGVARTHVINRTLDAVYEYIGYKRPGVDCELHDRITQQVQLERQQHLAQLAEEERRQAQLNGENLSKANDGGGRADETDR